MDATAFSRAAFAVIVGIVWTGAAARATPVMVTLPEGKELAAVAPATGMAAVIGNGLTLYPQLTIGSLTRPIDVKLDGADVLDAAAGRLDNVDVFVIADDRQQIRVIDAATGRVKSSLAVDGTLSSVGEPDAAGMVWYSVSRRNLGPMKNGLGRADLKNGKDEGLYHLTGRLDEGMGGGDLCVLGSTAGHVYASHRGVSPSGLLDYLVDTGGRALNLNLYDHISLAEVVVTSYGIGTAGTLRGENLRMKVRELEAPATAAVPGTPFVVGKVQKLGAVAGQAEKFAAITSLNSGRTVAQVKLPPEKTEAAGEAPLTSVRKRPLYEMPIFVDAGRKRVLVSVGRQWASLALTEFKLPVEPVLAVRVDGKRDLLVGEALALTVKTEDPAATVSLAKAPEGAVLAGGVIQWKPGATNLGPQEMVLRVEKGATRTESLVRVTVEGPAISLPFKPELWDVDARGYRAVVVSRADGASGPTRLAVVNFGDGKAIEEHRVEGLVYDAVIGSDAVYLSDPNADAIGVVKIGEVAEPRTVFTSGVGKMLSIEGGVLFVGGARGQENGRAAQRFTLPAMAPLEDTGPKRPSQSGRLCNWLVDPPPNQDRRVEDGWSDGLVVRTEGRPGTPATSQVMMIDPSIGSAAQATVEAKRSQRGWVDRELWGTHLEGGKIVRTSDQVMSSLNGVGPGLLHERLPVAVFMHYERRQSGDGFPLYATTVDVVELATGKKRSLDLAVTAGRVDDVQTLRRPGSLRMTADGVAVLDGDRIRVVPDDQLRGNGALPLYFEPKQSALMVPDGPEAKLTYGVKGGTGTRTFSLGKTVDWAKIDAASGEVTLITSALKLDHTLMRVAEAFRSVKGGDAATATVEDWESALAEDRQWVEERFGVKPKGVPVAVALTVIVRDQDQQAAELSHAVLIDVPVKRLVEVAQAQAAGRAARRASRMRGEAGATSRSGGEGSR